MSLYYCCKNCVFGGLRSCHVPFLTFEDRLGTKTGFDELALLRLGRYRQVIVDSFFSLLYRVQDLSDLIDCLHLGV